jgi:hypothetical protein
MYNNWLHKDILRKLHVSMRNNMLHRLLLLHQPLLPQLLLLPQLPLLLQQWIKQFTSNTYNNSWLKDMMRLLHRNMLNSMPYNMHNSKVEFCQRYLAHY